PMVAVAAAAAGGAMAAPLAEEEASGAAIDPVQSVLEEVDVMQAYGLHDRAREVLDEAIARMPEADVLQARRVRLFHETGARDEFLRAAEAYRTRHPAADDPHWAAIQAIGVAAYADAPLFGGSGVVQPETSGETVHESRAETVAALHPPFVLPEAVTAVEPAAVIQAGDVALELPTASESIETLPVEIGAPEQPAQEEASIEPLSLEWPALELGESREAEAPRAVEPELLPVLDLQTLSLEPAVAEEPSPAPVAGEAPVLPEVASPEVPPMSAAEAPVMPEMMAELGISEDDLMLLGLDTVSLETEPLDLPSLFVGEASQPTPSMTTAAPVAVESVVPPVQSPVVQEQEQERGSASSAIPAAALDERSLKLDMAQALIELGDLEGARGVLEEVLSSGEDELSARAREMLERTTP
ncbi:MAG: FimV/HubP family polar landmark protein, partial [Halothiobacillaceae bacterium]